MKKKRCLLSLLLPWGLCLSGSLRCVQCWLPSRRSKISSMKSKTCPLTWLAIHLSLERTSKLKKLSGNMSHRGYNNSSSYVSNQFWGTFKLKQCFEDGPVMYSPSFSPLKNYPRRKRTRNRKIDCIFDKTRRHMQTQTALCKNWVDGKD